MRSSHGNNDSEDARPCHEDKARDSFNESDHHCNSFLPSSNLHRCKWSVKCFGSVHLLIPSRLSWAPISSNSKMANKNYKYRVWSYTWRLPCLRQQWPLSRGTSSIAWLEEKLDRMIGPKQLVRLDILGCPIIRSAKIVLQRGDILYLPRRVYCKGNFKPCLVRIGLPMLLRTAKYVL